MASKQRCWQAHAGLSALLKTWLVWSYLLSSLALFPPSSWSGFPFAQVTESASFTQDLGLDSLDAVEVVLAVEEEFSIEIPDEEVRFAIHSLMTAGPCLDPVEIAC